MTFLWPIALLGLLVVPVLVAGSRSWAQKRSERNDATLGRGYVDLAPKSKSRFLSPVFATLALCVIIVGVARPQATLDVPRLRSTVILAFDTSESMSADDLEPTRLDAAKAAAASFIESQDDSVDFGVVSFGSLGAITLRPTQERVEVQAAIERLEPAGETNISEGVFSALSAIAEDPIIYLPDDQGNVEIPPVDFGAFGSALVVMFSDGEDTTETDPEPLAELAAQGGIRIYTIGVGTLEGTTLDVDGFSVSTALQEETLRNLADVSNGEYFLADAEEDLAAATDVIEQDLIFEEQRIEISGLFAVGGLVLFALAGVNSLLNKRRLP